MAYISTLCLKKYLHHVFTQLNQCKWMQAIMYKQESKQESGTCHRNGKLWFNIQHRFLTGSGHLLDYILKKAFLAGYTVKGLCGL